jgi:DNA replication protein DnaC
MPGLTDSAAQAAIVAACRTLALPSIPAEAPRLAQQAERERHSYLAYLAQILAVEVDERTARRIARRISEAHFPRLKRLADFDCAENGLVTPAQVALLAGGAYLARAEPVVLLGDSGTGKTHLLIGLGIAACEAGLRVRYTTAAALVNELVEAADERRLTRLLGQYARLDLVCLDELGYLQLDSRGAERLFQVSTARDERASIAVASNASFGEWGRFFTDARLAAAVVDRLTFKAHIIETGTESYRLRATRTRTARAGSKATRPRGGAESDDHGGARSD